MTTYVAVLVSRIREVEERTSQCLSVTRERDALAHRLDMALLDLRVAQQQHDRLQKQAQQQLLQLQQPSPPSQQQQRISSSVPMRAPVNVDLDDSSHDIFAELDNFPSPAFSASAPAPRRVPPPATLYSPPSHASPSHDSQRTAVPLFTPNTTVSRSSASTPPVSAAPPVRTPVVSDRRRAQELLVLCRVVAELRQECDTLRAAVAKALPAWVRDTTATVGEAVAKSLAATKTATKDATSQQWQARTLELESANKMLIAQAIEQKKHIDQLDAANQRLQARTVELETLQRQHSATIDAQTAAHTTALATVTDRFAREQAWRRRLHNELLTAKGNVRVVARVRPLLRTDGGIRVDRSTTLGLTGANMTGVVAGARRVAVVAEEIGGRIVVPFASPLSVGVSVGRSVGRSVCFVQSCTLS
jgi:hypothetical protein